MTVAKIGAAARSLIRRTGDRSAMMAGRGQWLRALPCLRLGGLSGRPGSLGVCIYRLPKKKKKQPTSASIARVSVVLAGCQQGGPGVVCGQLSDQNPTRIGIHGSA